MLIKPSHNKLHENPFISSLVLTQITDIAKLLTYFATSRQMTELHLLVHNEVVDPSSRAV
jgi:hypothetical protein